MGLRTLAQSVVQQSVFASGRAKAEERDGYPMALSQWIEMLNTGGYSYPLHPTLTGQLGSTEKITGDFPGLVQGAYRSNGVIFACELARLMLFSEARFQFRQVRRGRPGDLFGTAALGPLEEPWSGGTTGDLLTRMLQDADFAGNSFILSRGGQLTRLRPDWVTIVMGSRSDPDVKMWDLSSELLGYLYQEGGAQEGKVPQFLHPSEVAHFAPVPDPMSPYKGMSWLTPVLREIRSDSAATAHKLQFFEQGATVNLAVVLDPSVKKEMFDAFKEAFRADHEGALNAYKTVFLGGGADVKSVGSNFQQMDFKQVQGAGETRIAAAAGVPPIIVGLSEGLASATYSNYGMARRRYADLTMRPLWRNVAGSLARIIKVPPGSELWYDARDITFLQEDQKDAADIQAVRGHTIRSLIEAGFTAESAIKATLADDMTLLAHTGLFSVQLQAPGSVKMPVGEVPGETPVAGGTKPETTPPGEMKPATPAKEAPSLPPKTKVASANGSGSLPSERA